ncbi:MFS transporter [Rhodococcus koreensis]|uniref:MFS transporter n=1 Tax=Rhodococcus koreensis TaxID=99653 RepID=UPI00366F6EC9
MHEPSQLEAKIPRELPPATAPSSQSRLKALSAGAIGNAVEWYDMAIYAVMAPIYASLFFPSGNSTAQLLAAFALFGVGFVMRPIGAVVFGHLGDKVGRKVALSWAVILMSMATLGIGLVPTHAAIGIFAPVLLTLLRLLQGFSAGGEWGGSVAFMVEYAPDGKRGFFGSWQQVSVALGFLAGSLTSALVSTVLSTEALHSWGWRIPFLFGGVLGAVGFYLRRSLEETPRYAEAEAEAEVSRSPLRETFAEHKAACGRAFLYAAFYNVTYYILLTYTPTYLSVTLGYSFTQGLLASVITLIVFAVCIPFTGALSDRIGRKPLLLIACGGCVLFTYPLFLVMNAGHFVYVVSALAVFAILMSCFSGPGPAALAEMFPTEVRFTALSIGYNFGAVAFGAGAPFIATWLIRTTGTSLAPSYYVIFGCMITLCLVLTMRETAFSKLR